jgi:hypothetical protein
VRAGRNPPELPVWHASIRNHPADRTLTDAQWAHIAGEIVAAVGLAPHGDPNAVRWVAVRHAADHIHIVATLVRQDGNTVWAWNERIKAQAAARDLEQRYGLHRVGPTDRTSHRRPGAAEQNKAQRQGRREVPRDRLRREVRAAAAAATGEADFVARLRAAGVLVRLRHSSIDPNQITGYAVGLPDHRTAAGDTVWYGGGRLAPDLTLPRLRQRWNPPQAGHSSTAPHSGPWSKRRTSAFTRAAGATRTAAAGLTRGVTDDEVADVARAAGDLLAATARAFEGGRHGRLSAASDLFDRAARERYGRPVPRTTRGAELRAITRLIFVMGRLTGDRDTAAALQLLLQLSMLADTLADVREARQRLHQARAARSAAHRLRLIAATQTSPATPSAPAHDPTISRTAGARPPRRP